MKKSIGVAIVLVACVLAATFYWKARDAERRRLEAELEVGLNASRMINIAFQKRAELIVSRLSGDVVTSAQCDGRVFHPIQRTKAPASVAYTVDLRKLGPSSYHWDAPTKRLTIDAPDVQVGEPNVDISKQVVRQQGMYISRECGLLLTRQTAKQLANRARAEAAKPANLIAARSAAREAIAAFAGGVLSESNLGSVVVDVRLPGDPQQQAVNDQWDRSRSVNEVLDQGAK